jgi:hypothetical protein
MFRACAVEMLQRGLRSLDELDATKKAERIAKSGVLTKANPPSLRVPDPSDSLDPELAAALAAYDPSDPF